MKKRLVALLVLALVMVLALASCGDPIGDWLKQFQDNPPAQDPAEYVVYFFAGEGIGIPAQTVKEGELVTKPENPTMNGYHFDNWYKDSEFTEVWNFDTDAVTKNTIIYGRMEAHTGGTATCTEAPVCEVCGMSYGSALGHTVVVVEGIAPTCTTDGITDKMYCSVCNVVLADHEVAPATGHAPVVDAAVAPTCTETGLTEGSHCGNCNEVLTAQEVVNALGHSHEAAETAPTCTVDGSIVYTCACGDTYTVVVPATGHSHKAVVTAPTCTEAGYTTYTCSCGDTYTADHVPALGHKSEDGTHTCGTCGVTLSSCIDETPRDHECDLCGLSISECVDANKNHKCDICNDVMSKCADDDHNHFCDWCGVQNSHCININPTEDHTCDWCGATVDECVDVDPRDHECDICGLSSTECLDENKNHKCDICNDVMSKCADDDHNHFCDWCGVQNSHCININPTEDHTCDWCGATMSECADDDRDHECDICFKSTSDCADNNDDHKCDLCGATLSKCRDNDQNHFCDLCGVQNSHCININPTEDHTCDWCGATMSECADDDRDHECDICFKSTSDCADNNDDHKCDLCGATLSKCRDNDQNHFCDLCGVQNSHCININPTEDHSCDWCGATMGGCESVCEKCGKCLDTECADSLCAEKCEGHNNPISTTTTINLSNVGVHFEGNTGTYGELEIDATNGKFKDNGNWTQVNAGTVITLYVLDDAQVSVTAYYSASNFTITVVDGVCTITATANDYLSAIAVKYVVVYNEETTINLSNVGVHFEGSTGVYEGLEIDATNGKFKDNGDWTQVNTGTVITLNVFEGARVSVTAYYSASNFTITVVDGVCTITAVGNDYLKAIQVSEPCVDHTFGDWEVYEETDTSVEYRRTCECGHFESKTSVKVTLYHYTTWSNVNLYAWIVDPVSAVWPGSAMTAVDGKDGWFTATLVLETVEGLNVIFNNGSAQTSDLQYTGLNYWVGATAYATLAEAEEAIKNAEPPKTNVVYLVPNANWKQDNARYAIYTWDGGDQWFDMTDSDGDGVWEVELPDSISNIIFCRMNPSTTANNWNNKWNQSADLKVQTNGTNCYTVKAGTWDKGGGTWSTYTPAAHEHEYAEVVTDPTCEAEGYTTYTCDCGDTYTGNKVAALGHDTVVDKAVAATCTSTGLTEGSHCSVCNVVLTKQEITDALNHNYVEYNYAVVDGAVKYVSLCENDHNHVDALDVDKLTVIPVSDDALIQAALESGYSVYLTGDIALSSSLLIEGYVVSIDLNGHTLTADWESDVCEVIWARGEGTEVTINGNGSMISGKNSETNSVVSATDKAVVTINGGYYYSESFGAVIYATRSGVVNIYGGKFEAAEAFHGVWYVLDINEAESVLGDINVYGGEFVNYDPANCRNDGADTNKVSDGYHSIGNNGVYTVNVHSYNADVTDPTCVDKGFTTHTCVCGDFYVDTYVDELGHTDGETVVENKKAPTCTATGSYDNVVYCTVCGVEVSRETITVDATGHDYDADVTDPTCEGKGYTTYTCSVCGDTYVADEVEATGHDYDADVTDPTCEGKGYTTYTCSVCGDTYVADEVEATGHTEATVSGKDATCTEDGLTEGKKCSVCGEVTVAQNKIDALGHDEYDLEEKAATCEEDGSEGGTGCRTCGEILVAATVISALGHEHTTNAKICDNCGKEKVEEWVLVTDASQLSAGAQVVIVAKGYNYALSTAQNSNNRGQAAVTKNGNNVTFGSDVQILTLEAGTASGTWALQTGTGYLYAASNSSNHLKTQTTNNANGIWNITVTSAGVATIKATGSNARNWMRYNLNNGSPLFSCYGSGQEDIAIYIKSAGYVEHAHTEKTLTSKAATCTENGLTEGKQCTVCGEVTVAQTEIPATGHNYVIDKAVAPTCQTTGLTEGTHCENGCGIGTVAQDVVPVIDCIYVDGVCTMCGVAESHVCSPAEAVKENNADPTCTANGSYDMVVYCEGCGDKLSTEHFEVEATGHNYEDDVCTECGEKDPSAKVVKEITFNLGANGSASHNDGSSATTYTETVDGYKLSITNGTKMYTSARDAKGNSCLKFGTSSATGSMKFTVPDNVTKVVIYVAQYKTNATKVTINGTTSTITTASANGAYTPIEIDTTTTKTVNFATASGGVRAMINTIVFFAEE